MDENVISNAAITKVNIKEDKVRNNILSPKKKKKKKNGDTNQ